MRLSEMLKVGQSMTSYTIERIVELEAECDVLKLGAERYRKVRRMASCGELPREWTEGYTERELDTAVDAAKGA